MPFKDPEVRRQKSREYSRRYRLVNRDERNERQRQRAAAARLAHPERFKEQREAFRAAHPGYHANYMLARYYKARELVFDAIGWSCIGCGHQDPRVIEADHRADDAAADRLRFGRGRGVLEYYAKHPEEARQRLQPLCRNCNWLKRKGHPLPAHQV